MANTHTTAVHPLLDKNSIKPLPLMFRRRAYAALDVSQSPEVLQNFCALAKSLPIASILHILYVNLVESQLPSRVDLAQNLESGIAPIAPHRAVIALKVLARRVEDIPSSTAPHLWPVVWRWSQFLAINYQCVPDLDEVRVGFALAAILRPLYDHAPTAAAIDQTPGVRTLIAHSWMLALQNKLKTTEWEAWDVAYMLYRSDFRYTKHSAEFIEGAGSVSNLAYIVVRLMVRCMPLTEPPSGQSKYAFDTVCGFLRMLLYDAHFAIKLCPALVTHNAATTLVLGMKHAFEGYQETNISTQAILLEFCIATSTHPRYLVRALNAGLLRLVILIASSSKNQPTVEVILKFRWLEQIARWLVYRNVVEAMPDALADVKDITQSDTFLASSMGEDFTKLVDLTQSRLKMLEIVTENRLIKRIACGNAQCQTLRLVRQMKICSGCKQAGYCDIFCQRADWAARHRSRCGAKDILQPDPPKESASVYTVENGLRGRNYEFLTAIAHTDFNRLRKTARVLCDDFKRQNPSSAALARTFFDYSIDGTCHVSAGASSEFPWAHPEVPILVVAVGVEGVKIVVPIFIPTQPSEDEVWGEDDVGMIG
ncbi:hypothetical protein C8F01DRAFT_1367420 [Mycena amicta]|nr:hypothetical protein C8F01DRAFT_1367420 [Mycena amicta]